MKEKLRKVFKYLQATAIEPDEYGSNAHVKLSGQKYFVGKMSYDKWFIEPYYKGRTERDKHHEGTLWEDSEAIELIDLFCANGLMQVDVL